MLHEDAILYRTGLLDVLSSAINAIVIHGFYVAGFSPLGISHEVLYHKNYLPSYASA
jgi:hypothetical protein